MLAGTESSHQAITDAAIWLATTPRDVSRPIIQQLVERFGLTKQEAIEAIRAANLQRARAL